MQSVGSGIADSVYYNSLQLSTMLARLNSLIVWSYLGQGQTTRIQAYSELTDTSQTNVGYTVVPGCDGRDRQIIL